MNRGGDGHRVKRGSSAGPDAGVVRIGVARCGRFKRSRSSDPSLSPSLSRAPPRARSLCGWGRRSCA